MSNDNKDLALVYMLQNAIEDLPSVMAVPHNRQANSILLRLRQLALNLKSAAEESPNLKQQLLKTQANLNNLNTALIECNRKYFAEKQNTDFQIKALQQAASNYKYNAEIATREMNDARDRFSQCTHKTRVDSEEYMKLIGTLSREILIATEQYDKCQNDLTKLEEAMATGNITDTLDRRLRTLETPQPTEYNPKPNDPLQKLLDGLFPNLTPEQIKSKYIALDQYLDALHSLPLQHQEVTANYNNLLRKYNIQNLITEIENINSPTSQQQDVQVSSTVYYPPYKPETRTVIEQAFMQSNMPSSSPVPINLAQMPSVVPIQNPQILPSIQNSVSSAQSIVDDPDLKLLLNMFKVNLDQLGTDVNQARLKDAITERFLDHMKLNMRTNQQQSCDLSINNAAQINLIEEIRRENEENKLKLQEAETMLAERLVEHNMALDQAKRLAMLELQAEINESIAECDENISISNAELENIQAAKAEADIEIANLRMQLLQQQADEQAKINEAVALRTQELEQQLTEPNQELQNQKALYEDQIRRHMLDSETSFTGMVDAQNDALYCRQQVQKLNREFEQYKYGQRTAMPSQAVNTLKRRRLDQSFLETSEIQPTITSTPIQTIEESIEVDTVSSTNTTDEDFVTPEAQMIPIRNEPPPLGFNITSGLPPLPDSDDEDFDPTTNYAVVENDAGQTLNLIDTDEAMNEDVLIVHNLDSTPSNTPTKRVAEHSSEVSSKRTSRRRRITVRTPEQINSPDRSISDTASSSYNTAPEDNDDDYADYDVDMEEDVYR